MEVDKIKNAAECLLHNLNLKSWNLEFDEAWLQDCSPLLDEFTKPQMNAIATETYNNATPLVKSQMLALLVVNRCRFFSIAEWENDFLVNALARLFTGHVPAAFSNWAGVNRDEICNVDNQLLDSVGAVNNRITALVTHALRPIQFLDAIDMHTAQSLCQTYLDGTLLPTADHLVQRCNFTVQQAARWLMECQRLDFCRGHDLKKKLAAVGFHQPTRSRSRSPKRSPQ